MGEQKYQIKVER